MSVTFQGTPINLDQWSYAASLLSDDGENPEYDRAIVELIAGLSGISTDFRDEILARLRQWKDDRTSSAVVYLIRMEPDENGDRLWWSNHAGGVGTTGQADPYGPQDKEDYEDRLPLGGEWVEFREVRS